MKGTRDLNFYQPEQIKRVRLVRRADGYYAQLDASNASGDVTSTLVGVIQSGQVVSLKEESHAL